MQLTVEEIYSRLVNDDKILTKKGRITFSLGDIDIIVRQRDVVGNIMQEWIEGWLKKNGIEYALNENTQMPPDFYLNPKNKTEELMEIKAFNYKAGPGFDIADFRMYEQEIDCDNQKSMEEKSMGNVKTNEVREKENHLAYKPSNQERYSS